MDLTDNYLRNRIKNLVSCSEPPAQGRDALINYISRSRHSNNRYMARAREFEEVEYRSADHRSPTWAMVYSYRLTNIELYRFA
jgi:hypothetical protein